MPSREGANFEGWCIMHGRFYHLHKRRGRSTRSRRSIMHGRFYHLHKQWKPSPSTAGMGFECLCMMSQEDLTRAQAVKTEALD